MAHRRPSGDGLVRKRKDGRWEGRIMVGRDQEGKPIYRSVVDKSQKEMLERLHGLIEAYREVELTDRKNYTLGEWLDKWLNEIMSMHLRPSTMSNYRNIIKYRIKPYLGDVPLHKVTRPDIQRMYVKIKKSGRVEEHVLHGDELSDSSVRSTHMLLHQAMDYAVKEKLILENPTNGTRIPKLNYAPMKVLDEVQLNAFLEVIEQDPIWYDFFYTELTTGLRRGEMCGLMWQDFNAKNGTLQVKRQVVKTDGEGLTVNDPKTKTGIRLIHLPPSTVNLLTNRKKHSYSRWIFPNPVSPESPMNPQTPYNRLKVLLRYAGIPPIRFHDLRHTFATHAMANGVDPKTLSSILGHTNASFTLDTYTHVTMDMQQKASNVVESFLMDIM